MDILQSDSFWILVAFVLFVGVVAKKAYTRVTSGLDARAERIRGELEEARRLREEAQVLLASFQKKQREAKAEAEAILKLAREEVERRAEQAERDIEAMAKRRAEQAQQSIAQAEAAALKEVRDAAVDAALAATATLLRQHLDERRSDELIERAMKDLPKALH